MCQPPMLQEKDVVNLIGILLMAELVVGGGFGRRATINTTLRTYGQAAGSVWMAAVSTLVTTLFGPLYG